ncbi:MAG: GTP cyclohydrolase I FolE [Bdellovibrionales bacterium]|nr:GTP cyclohydrolase I FolE [Bdellovibrionales bacterium]
MKSKKTTSLTKSAKSAKQPAKSADFWLKDVLPSPQRPNGLSDDQKRTKIEASVKDILETLGMDLENDSIADTPRRIAKMYVDEIFSGLNGKNVPKITTIKNEMKYDQMIVVRDIAVLSTCEHHFQTIDGRAVVAYIPTEKVIGLSKINRIVDFFARRPQVQERLTKQIADALETLLGTPHVAVSINAKHYCVIARGIRDVSSTTSTTEVRGDFKESEATRKEFLTHCRPANSFC